MRFLAVYRIHHHAALLQIILDDLSKATSKGRIAPSFSSRDRDVGEPFLRSSGG